MSPDAITLWSYALIVALIVLVLVNAFIFGPAAIALWTPIVRSVIAWGRHAFTAAGDGCIDCNRWSLPVACLSCGRTRVMTATKTIATDGQTAASIAQARAVTHAERRREGIGPDGRHVISFEERRRRAAMTAFEEIDLDLDETVAH